MRTRVPSSAPSGRSVVVCLVVGMLVLSLALLLENGSVPGTDVVRIKVQSPVIFDGTGYCPHARHCEWPSLPWTVRCPGRVWNVLSTQ